jgi:hypothetical protein
VTCVIGTNQETCPDRRPLISAVGMVQLDNHCRAEVSRRPEFCYRGNIGCLASCAALIGTSWTAKPPIQSQSLLLHPGQEVCNAWTVGPLVTYDGGRLKGTRRFRW